MLFAKNHLFYSHIKLGLPLSHTCFRQAYHCRVRWSISYLNVLQLVRQVRPLGLQHVGLVQSVLQALGQPEDVALLEVHLLLQLPLLWRQGRCDVERRVHIKPTPCLYGSEKRYKNITTKRLSFFHLLFCAIFLIKKEQCMYISIFFFFHVKAEKLLKISLCMQNDNKTS